MPGMPRGQRSGFHVGQLGVHVCSPPFVLLSTATTYFKLGSPMCAQLLALLFGRSPVALVFAQTTPWWGCPERAYCSAFLVLRVLQLGQPCGLAAAPQWFCTFCGRHSPTCACSSTPLSLQFLQTKQHCMQTPQCFAISYSLLWGPRRHV